MLPSWRQGRSVEAEAIYLRACRIEPNDFRILTNLGLALYSQGKVDLAGESYLKALEQKPDAFDAARQTWGLCSPTRGSPMRAAGPLERARALEARFGRRPPEHRNEPRPPGPVERGDRLL